MAYRCEGSVALSDSTFRNDDDIGIPAFEKTTAKAPRNLIPIHERA